MAPTKPSKNAIPPITGDASAPLADYFFICGIESSQVFDDRIPLNSPIVPVQDTIDENREFEVDAGNRPTTPGSPTENHRRSRYSFEARKSVGSIIINVEPTTPSSNRSSATIKPTTKIGGSGMSDDAFEEALKKFASERDSFIEEVHVSAGAVTSQTQRRSRPKTVRITSEENVLGNGGTIKSGVGSIRRRISTMKTMQRQSSVMSRASVRTSRRLSGYNSVIPAPQPFHTTPDMHPLKRRYEPVLLDRYPTKTMVDETKRRIPFPDYVPMFVYPNDVTVVSSDERPRSTWHGFAMTGGDNSRLYAVCVTVWVPLNASASDGLERQCEEWRRANMSGEERELASSLGERLSAERAKLSRLLAELPTVPSGSEEREQLEDDISSVEEKIGLMADLLRPVRHGAASKIDGLTQGDTGFWIPRSYGILGRDGSMTSFWKEWLKAIVVPMLNDGTLSSENNDNNRGVIGVTTSGPRFGFWQPLERYVCNLCIEAPCPITSMTQVEVSLRDLRLYARKEAINELPGSRNTDLYALFRCLTVPNIIILFEYAMAESRIILLSSHTGMLHLASSALASLLYPFKWASIFIPVLPARLLAALDAPCPYIVGVEKRYDKLDFPDDDFCVVDLDENSIESTAPPISLPRPQRRKLMSLLQAAAPHHTRFGVPLGPPQYAVETFPFNRFSSENPQIFTANPAPSTLAHYVGESSTNFGSNSTAPHPRNTVFNAFLQQKTDGTRGSDRPSTSSTGTGNSRSSSASPPSPTAPSPTSTTFPSIPFSSAPFSRNDSGLALQTSLREKRSGHFTENIARRNSAVTSLFQARHPLHDKTNTPEPPALGAAARRPSAPIISHHSSLSTSTFGNGNYAPSVYAQSTLAASTIMQPMTIQPVHDNDTTKWMEGHCLQRRPGDNKINCTICDDRCDEEIFRCSGCGINVHARCAPAVCMVCPVAFRADQVRAAFVRCFASLLYTYRKYMYPASGERKKSGLIYHFNMDQFLRSVPHGADGEYMHMLRETQAFNEFIHDREATRPDSDPQQIKLFDEIILSKRARRGTATVTRLMSRLGGSSSSHHLSSPETAFLADSSDHLWRSAAATPPNAANRFQQQAPSSGGSNGSGPGVVAGRTPAKLDPSLMKEPRTIQGAPRIQQPGRTTRKPVPSMLGLSAQSASEP